MSCIFQFAAVCQASLVELPTVTASLETLDTQLAKLCKEYQVPPPPPPGTHDQNDKDNSGGVVDLKAASSKVEKNRSHLTHSKHQAQDIVKNMESALKKARTAFVW